MVKIVAFAYIFATIIYLTIGSNARGWSGYNMLTILVPLALMMYLPKPTTAFGKDLINYAIGLTLVRSLYTVVCIYADKEWIYEKTNWFTAAVIITFISFLIYSAVAHKRL
jgi:hypothetical protein